MKSVVSTSAKKVVSSIIIVFGLVSCNGSNSNPSPTPIDDYRDTLIGGGVLTFSYPASIKNDDQSSFEASINNVTANNGYLLSFTIQGGNNLKGGLIVRTDPEKCVMTTSNNKCKVIFDAVNATDENYTITPTYQYNYGDIESAKSFTVTVSPKPVPPRPLSAFITYTPNGSLAVCDGKSDNITNYVSVGLDHVQNAMFTYIDLSYGRVPMYVAIIKDDLSANSHSYMEYSSNGYDWNISNNPCEVNEDMQIENRFQARRDGISLGVVAMCVTSSQGNTILHSIWSSDNAKTWDMRWSSHIAPYQSFPLVFNSSSLFYTSLNRIQASGCKLSAYTTVCSSLDTETYRLRGNEWVINESFTIPTTTNMNIFSDNRGAILEAQDVNAQENIFYSFDFGETWRPVNRVSSNFVLQGYIAATELFYAIDNSSASIATSTSSGSWNTSVVTGLGGVFNDWNWGGLVGSYSSQYGYLIPETDGRHISASTDLPVFNPFGVVPVDDSVIVASY